jgi:hypothetical protein
MTDRPFDRIADAFLADGPDVLPDRVLESAFEEVHRTHQRRVLVRGPWRFPTMNTYAKLAVGAVAVVAIGLIGLNFLGPGQTGVGGAPSATPSASAEPSPSATVVPTPTPTPGLTAPPLTGGFTSEMHGISIAYPATWLTRPATEPWTSGFLDFGNEAGDALYEPSNPGNIWLTLASQPLGDRTPAEWEADVWQYLIDDDPGAAECAAATEPITIDGAPGVIACNLVLVTDGGRGYSLLLYVSDDDPSDAEVYDEAWFASVLATVQLQPEAAVDAASPAPS